MAKEKILERVKKAVEQGALWKAKEILQGSISSAINYDEDIYERYGQILLEMQDKIEAGKYLFLSGRRQPEYEESINLYLNRYSKRYDFNLYHTFPTAARLLTKNEYPENVRNFLDEQGIKDFKESFPPKPSLIKRHRSLLGGFIAYSLLAIFLLGIGYVFYSGFKVLYIWFFGQW